MYLTSAPRKVNFFKKIIKDKTKREAVCKNTLLFIFLGN